MREKIDATAFTDMLLCAAAALEASKQQLNDLNVFPVPDGDTGTNMSMTMGAGALELKRKQPDTAGDAAKYTAAALLRGARGNSGVILSLLFRGMAKVLKNKATFDAYDLALAMHEGVEAAYQAVMKPAEGTILTVSRLAAAAAVDFAQTGSDIELLFSCALETAKDALSETVNQNPVLKKAGVIDAGGKGYVIILEAMLASLRGEVSPDSYEAASKELKEQADFVSFSASDITFTYCTEFIISRNSDKAVNSLQKLLHRIGDSVVIVDDEEMIKIHIHTNDPGIVLTEAIAYGGLLDIKIDNMREQHSSMVESGENAAVGIKAPAEPEKEFGTVVVCAGAGLQDLFRELGADGIVTGGQTMNPSTEDILTAIEGTPAHTVFVFPNNKNIIMAAEQCAPLTEKRVIVIPTKTIPQGVTSMLNMDTYTQNEEQLRSIAYEAIDSVHTALITYAARDSEYDGHEIKAGEYLALLDGVLLGSGPDLNAIIYALCDSFESYDPEFITIYYGEDVEPESAQEVKTLFETKRPSAELSLINGGQPVYYYIISAE